MSLEVLQRMLDEGLDSEEFALEITRVQSSIATFSPDALSNIINSLAEWIAKHSASKKLEIVLALCIEIFVSQGFSEEYFYPLNDENQSLPSNNLVSCVLSLINSILKSNQAEKYIRLLSKLLIISSFIVHQKSVPDSFRRKSTLKLMMILYKNLIKAGAKSEHSVKILTLLGIVFCKISFYSGKCREYLVRKGAIQAYCLILNSNDTYARDEKLLYSTLYAMGNLAGNVDQQLLIWVSGGVSLALNYFEKKEFQEPASFIIWKSCIDALEVQELLFTEDFQTKAMSTLNTFPSAEISTFLIGTLRRLSSNPEYKNQLADRVSACFLVWLKELTKKSFMLPLKELAAGLGSLCTRVQVAQEVVKAAGIEIIIEVILRHISQAKLVKTCVGALVNLSVQGNNKIEGIVDRITSNLKFYEMINLLLDTYYASNFMMEYALKLILNGLQNNNCLYHLSEKQFFNKMVKVLDFSRNDEDIFLLCVCIFRASVSHSKEYTEKGLEEFKDVVKPTIIEMLLVGYQKYLPNLKVLTEVILMLSAIAQDEGVFLEYLKNCSLLSESIKISLEFHGADKNNTAVLTECMANLPVEEFNMIL